MERKRITKRKSVDTPTIKISKGECPICFQIPRAHIFQCVNGHSICEPCSALVPVCPMCQSCGIRIRNLLAESLLDDIQFKCSWSQRGCDETMTRSELSSHEDQCDQNPDIIKFCSKVQIARNCPYKFTSKWLSDPENCSNFINHVTTCGNSLVEENIQYGLQFHVPIWFDEILSKEFNPSRLAHQSHCSFVFRVASQNDGKDQLVVLFILLKLDSRRNKTLSFAFVQLTPETTKMVVEVGIDGKPSSNMVSKYGQNSIPFPSWTQKPMSFNRFLEMVQKSPDSAEPELPFPFALPVSLLQQYYSCEDINGFTIRITINLMS